MKKWFLLLSLSYLLSTSQGVCWADDFTHTPKIVVKGEASILKPADQMEITLGVVTIAETSSQALNENNQRMRDVIANLQGLGLNELEYQTGRFQVRPVYQKKDSKQEDVQAKIAHYEVLNTIHLKSQKLDLADKIIGAAVEGGANQIEQVNFNLSNPQAYREEAIQVAVQNALSDAHALASAARVHPGRILFISLDQWQNLPGPLHLARMAGSQGNETSFEPGNVEVHATVHVTLEIMP